MNKNLMVLAGLILSIILLVVLGIKQNHKYSGVRSSLKLVSATSPQTADISGFKRASKDNPIIFPEDFGPHPEYQTEWWYYTGNLITPKGERFGYQLTFFRRGLIPPDKVQTRSSHLAANQVYMAHFALTDVESKKHHAFEKLARGIGDIAGARAEPYGVWLEDWIVEELSSGEYRLIASQDGFGIEIYLKSQKAPVLHGEQGYSQKSADSGNASHYYSQTRLISEGQITIQNRQYRVSGLSWKDHEYSTSALSSSQIGWDWFSIQLDNQYELMIFQIRDDDGTIDTYSSGTLITPDAEPIHLSKDEFSIEILDYWNSPRSKANYSSSWIIEVPSQNIKLKIKPYLNDQEMNVSYTYWEGAVFVSGEQNGEPVSGNGYVEMTGYAGSMAGEF